MSHEQREATSATHPAHPQACAMCNQDSGGPLVRMRNLRPRLSAFLARKHPEAAAPSAEVCRACLDRVRVEFLLSTLEHERGELSHIEADIARKAAAHETLAANIDHEFEKTITPTQRLADRVAKVGGSWLFVASFVAFMFVWIALNVWALRGQAFDPYPFILLNLLLSCIAALQAPVIMMSQNRLSARDRRQADQDFRVNLKAELEVASLHEKLDHLLHNQWDSMVELQQVQIDLLHELSGRKRGPAAG
jgi:uncharacterized membrane protein